MDKEHRRSRSYLPAVENEKIECATTIVYLIERYRVLTEVSLGASEEIDDHRNSRALIKDLIDRVLWAHSEVLGKYSKKQIWSAEALSAYKQSLLDDICLEHPYERAKMKNELVSNDHFRGPGAVEAVSSFLQRFCFGVVITRDEHKELNKLNRNLGFQDELAWRKAYTDAGIALIDPTE